MKNKIIILGICLIGLLFRLIFINKPDGLWNDEYVSWAISSIKFNEGFWNGVVSQCHMPLYYLYLKLFTNLFGNSDLLLRLTSVFAGVCSILAMYFVGREKDYKTGYYCAGFTAISSFLIYYSQEVRLYSLLFLFSAFNLLYTIRILKNTSKTNIFYYGLFNFLILITHTIGFVYVFFNLLTVSINLYKKHKKQIIYLWSAIIIIFLSILPLIIKIFSTRSFSQWWGHMSLSKIGFLFTDYFSPIITNLTNSPDNFLYRPDLIIFGVIPALIVILCILKSIINTKTNRSLFYITALFISILVLASLKGKLVFLTKYSIEIYPILIYLACYGIRELKNNIIRNLLLTIYCLISIGYIIFHPYSAPKMHRAEGHKIPIELIKKMNIKNNDYIILEYYSKERFEKYFDFSKYNVISINKGNFQDFITSGTTYSEIYNDGKNIYKSVFTKDDEYLRTKLDKMLTLQNGQSVILVLLDSVSFYKPDEISKIVGDEKLYSKTPLLFLVFSYLKKETFEHLVDNLFVESIYNKGMWTVIKFTKLNTK